MKKYIENRRKRRSGITKEREHRKEIKKKIKEEEGGTDEN